MKKEANVQRMAEKQKEAKLAVCTVLYKNSLLLVIVCVVFLCL